ncbi:hypothetical protein [Okeania sp. KiyG1]|uniref:hypothetical protein n=1 Tax=Okeania sp. KiyG1 TaxID=2720165 RepID=UPI001924D58E|nr:hypothetical protein [Okeania sp. KiyG1]
MPSAFGPPKSKYSTEHEITTQTSKRWYTIWEMVDFADHSKQRKIGPIADRLEFP